MTCAGRRQIAGVAVGLLIYAILGIALARSRAPICDEGFYGDPAFNLVTHHNMGSPTLIPQERLRGIEKYTYWAMPLHILAQAAWYRVFGVSIYSLRALTLAWGAIALLAWYLITAALFPRTPIPAIAAVLLSMDFTFLLAASIGRSDIMSFALGSAALAVYLRLRERNLVAALFAGHALTAASGLTHPNGGMAALAAIVLATLWFDRKRLSGGAAVAILVPYCAAAAGWAAYILQAPGWFAAQFFSSAAGRLSQAAMPWLALRGEIGRYLEIFGARPGGVAAARLCIPVIYGLALATTAGIGALRRERHTGFVLAAAGAQCALLTLFEELKQPWYFLYLLPFLLCISAIAGCHLWTQHRAARPVLAVVAVMLVCLQAGPAVILSRRNAYQTQYLATVKVLNQLLRPGEVAVGSAELGFGIGFDRLFDDKDLGCAKTNYPTPAILVVDRTYAGHHRQAGRSDRGFAECIQKRLTGEFAPVYANALYSVYARPHPAHVAQAAELRAVF